MTVAPYPLQFKPEMKERVWGGRALEQFGLELPEGAIGEGWMIGDHPNGTTKVINGALSGKGLDEIREAYGKEWFGSRGFSEKNGRFPLLIKLLDCNDDLSVQVHPTDSYEGLPAGELGKTEMWYILDAKPDAKIIYGLKSGIDRAALEAAIAEGRIMDTLQEVSVKAGDAFYIPAGTVHALCAGVVVAEIQQNSDTTYRLYDYNRPGLDGQLRELHIEDSLNVIAYEGAGATRMETGGIAAGEWLEIARSPYFVVEKGIVDGPWSLSTSPESFVILVIAEGQGTLKWADGSQAVKAGECFLVPAQLGHYELDGKLTVLRSQLP
ncbi:type I phosphomannose isomerase catalytic subunit [Paenibacillus sp. GCM10012307]|uniref:Mannose-6-phosphate isomerase n=1 Tax=Paenibacillus roseus TaxID=2798579 RepID=A0A934J4N9_9BACL|nr:type I phosphomannose isomerase catalytic subunit [Paenibacillus roseus]MBJ6361473.1 class I mannose-6-phosphate isomerase [Paenibacillus roseus]